MDIILNAGAIIEIVFWVTELLFTDYACLQELAFLDFLIRIYVVGTC